MRLVIQRVKSASVAVEQALVSEIGRGLLVLAGIAKDDDDRDLEYCSRKILGIRLFPDGEKETALSVMDISGEILIVSQFTLYGDVRNGRRPSFSEAMPPEPARELFDKLVHSLSQHGLGVKTGVFGAMMDVNLHNDGPYTIMVDSKKSF